MSTKDNLISAIARRMHTAMGSPANATEADLVALGRERRHLAKLIADDALDALGNPTDGVINSMNASKTLRTSTREQWNAALMAIRDGK